MLLQESGLVNKNDTIRSTRKKVIFLFTLMAGRMMGEEWGYDYGMGHEMMGLHFVFGIVTWALLIALLAGLVRWVWRKGDKVK